MIYFHNDYNEVCHKAIMERMQQVQNRQMPGYGMDDACASAASKIRKLCGKEDLDVHFLVGGTQTNLTVIAASLRPYQAVIAAESAHIQVHETGAIEATGHKVIALPSQDGKLTAKQIAEAARSQSDTMDPEHTAQPKMIYLSDSTELGTIYTLAELEAISRVCKKYRLYLFIDGARLGYALTAEDNDVTLADLARLCDVFYIGGTKGGAMFGEAVVISNPEIATDFRYMIKQRGAMLAKGWLLGLQFDVLMDHNLYFEIAAHANKQADLLRKTLAEHQVPMLVPGTTNQVFPILPDAVLEALEKEYTFSRMHRVDAEHSAIRFCTSWATRQEDTDGLCAKLSELLSKKSL